jgi:L,D-transpeptidase YnhG
MSSRLLGLSSLVATSILLSGFWCGVSFAKNKSRTKSEAVSATVAPPYEAETRLIAIYKLIGVGQAREALPLAAELTKNFPTFQLGHLIYGDLLTMQTKPLSKLGELPASLNKATNAAAWAELREESLQRVKALQDRPTPGTIPSQILGLTARNTHVIAVDASKSRLYVLENSDAGLKLVMDTYISVGKEGVGKYIQGDLKTPLGVYYVATPIDPKLLAPLYGGGALPINYPNPFDQRLGKSGSGIWLHGTMPGRYSRPVKATDGCVVMANPDLKKLMAIVAIKTTPVIIASKLQWVKPEQLMSERKQFESSLSSWRELKNSGQIDKLYNFYTNDFSAYGKSLTAWWPNTVKDIQKANKQPFQWREVTILSWRSESNDKSSNMMVVTYDEVLPKHKHSVTKRQYWLQVGNQWKIFFEGTIAAS